jgi:hypothetical protein
MTDQSAALRGQHAVHKRRVFQQVYSEPSRWP